MKQLTLIRHGKSDHSFGLADIERPLNERGESDAVLMGSWLIQQQIHFDQIFTSPAKRALTTAKLVSGQLDDDINEIVIEPLLYTFDSDGLYRFIETTDDQLSDIVIVGHNPGITLLVNDLCYSSPIDNMPTCGIAQIELAITDWVEIAPGTGKLKQFSCPKQHK